MTDHSAPAPAEPAPTAARTLVIDTATAACSVALIERDAVIARDHLVVGRGHAEQLVPMIARLPDGGRAARIGTALVPTGIARPSAWAVAKLNHMGQFAA